MNNHPPYDNTENAEQHPQRYLDQDALALMDAAIRKGKVVQTCVPWDEKDVELRLIAAVVALFTKAQSEPLVTVQQIERAIGYLYARYGVERTL